MEALKFLRRMLVVLMVLRTCANADREIKCDGHDFECDGAYRFVTCVYLQDGQKLYQPKQCVSGTVCNSNNSPSGPCDLNTVPSSTISTAPTSTADRATTLRGASTLPYVRSTRSPEPLLSKGDGKEIQRNGTTTELDIHKETLPAVEDSMKVSFGVNITGDLEVLGNNSTNVTTLMSIEPPSSIKTSSKVVFEKPAFIKETSWKGPIVQTNTTIENIKKQPAMTQININTLMEAVFRFPVLQTQNLITFSNMNVMHADNSSISVNVATDVAGTEMSSDKVAVTTNTTISFGSPSQNDSIGYLSEENMQDEEEVAQSVKEPVPKPGKKQCTKCQDMKCSHTMNGTNKDAKLVQSGVETNATGTVPEITTVHSLTDSLDNGNINKTIEVLTAVVGSSNSAELTNNYPLNNSSVLLGNEQNVTETQSVPSKIERIAITEQIYIPGNISQINTAGISNETQLIPEVASKSINITRELDKSHSHIDGNSKNKTKESFLDELIKIDKEPRREVFTKIPNIIKNQTVTPSESHSLLYSAQNNDTMINKEDEAARLNFGNTTIQNQATFKAINESLSKIDSENVSMILDLSDDKHLNKTNKTVVVQDLLSTLDNLSAKNQTEMEYGFPSSLQPNHNNTSNLNIYVQNSNENLSYESFGNRSRDIKILPSIESAKNSSKDLSFISVNTSVIPVNQSIQERSGYYLNSTHGNSFGVSNATNVLTLPELVVPTIGAEAKISIENITLHDNLKPIKINATSSVKESVLNQTLNRENMGVPVNMSSIPKLDSISNKTAQNASKISNNGSMVTTSMEQITPVDMDNILNEANATLSNQTHIPVEKPRNGTHIEDFLVGTDTFVVSSNSTNRTQYTREGEFTLLNATNGYPFDSKAFLSQNNSANSAEVQYPLSNTDFLNITTEEPLIIPNATRSPPSSVFDVNPTTASAENFMSQNYLSLEETDTTTKPPKLNSNNFDAVWSAENVTDVYSTPSSPATKESIYETTEKGALIFQFRTPSTILATIDNEDVNTTSSPLTIDNDPFRYSLKDPSVHQAEDVQVQQSMQKDYLTNGFKNNSILATLSTNQSSVSLSNISSFKNISAQLQNVTAIKYENIDTPSEALSEVPVILKRQEIAYTDEGYDKNQHNKRLAIGIIDSGIMLASNDTTTEKISKTLEDYTVSPNWPDMDMMKRHPFVSETTFLQSDDIGSTSKQGVILTNENQRSNTSNTVINIQAIIIQNNLTTSESLRSNFSVEDISAKLPIVSTYNQELQKRELENIQRITLTKDLKPDNASTTDIIPEEFDTGRSEMTSYSIPATVIAEPLDVTTEIVSLNLNQSRDKNIDVPTVDPSNLLKDVWDTRNISAVTEIADRSEISIIIPNDAVLGTENIQVFNSSGFTEIFQNNQKFNLNESEISSLKQFVTKIEPLVLNKTINEVISDHQAINASKDTTSATFSVPHTTSGNIQSGNTEIILQSLNESSQLTENKTLKFSNETSQPAPISVSAEQAALASATTADQNEPKDRFPCTNHGVYPDKLDCQKYHLCVKQRVGYVKITGSCAPRSAFSIETQRCSPDVSACYKEKCTSQIDFGDPLDETSYFSCKEVRPGVFHMYHMQCGAPLKFISNERKCGSPSNFSEGVQNIKTTVVQTIEETTVEPQRNSSNVPIVLIEPDYKEIQATTTVYETAFIESFPVNNSNSLSSRLQGGSTESLMRTVRSTHPFVCYQEGLFVNPMQCSEFYMCVKGVTNDFTQILRKCPPRYAFHEKTKSCSRDLSVCPELWCRGHGNFPHPSDDNSYYRCVPNAAGGFRIYHILCEESKKFVPSESVCLGHSIDPTIASSHHLSTHDIEKDFIASTSDNKIGRISKRSTTAATNDNSLDLKSKEETDRTIVSENYRKEAEARLRGILKEMRDEAARQHDTGNESAEGFDQKSSNSSEEVILKLNTANKDFVCQEPGRFADRFDCRKYFICSKKTDELKLHHLECRGKDRFDARKRICVDEEDAHCA